MNQGIIRHANDATSQYKIAEEKEKIALGYQNYKMDKIANPNATLTVDTATVEGSEAEGGWTITFTETDNVYELDTNGNITKTEDPAQDEIAKIRAGYNKYQSDKEEINQKMKNKEAELAGDVNQTDLDLLEQYCIGNNNKDLIVDILNTEADPMTFKDNEPIANASEELTYVNIGQSVTDNGYEIYIYFTYNGNSYKLTSGYEPDEENEANSKYPTKKVEPSATPEEVYEALNPFYEELSKLQLTVEDADVSGNQYYGWTITFEDTGNKYTLKPDGTIETIKELTLDKSSVSVVIDNDNKLFETASVKAIAKGGLKNIQWAIEDSGIATINKTTGTSVTVTAVKTGTTTLTASSEEYSATCTVTVKKGFKYGNVFLAIGDYINYDNTKDANGKALTTEYTSYSAENSDSEKNNGRSSGYKSDQTFKVSNYRNGWRVMGVSNGKVQLISAYSIGTYYLQGQNAYTDGTEELNAISEIYGHGKGAESARSVNIEDINSYTGYNPESADLYGKDTISQYGNEVTWYWTGTRWPHYSGSNGVTGDCENTVHYWFVWWDGNEWKKSQMSTTATNTVEGRERITTLVTNYYEYSPYYLRDEYAKHRASIDIYISILVSVKLHSS